MNFSLSGGWRKQLISRIEGFEFEVGILEDKPHLDPVGAAFGKPQSLGSYAGGPIRKTARGTGDKTTSEVFIANQERLDIDLLQRPFKDQNSDIVRFTTEFLKMACKKPGISMKRVENLLQAVVRNPILKQEYGKNSARTADDKGFDRLLFDTGQMFKAIIARAKRVRK